MRILLLLVWLTGLSSSIYAQQVTLKGRVFDSVGHKGLAYASVSLVRQEDSTLVGFTVADSTGHFELNRITRGKYLVSTSYVGYIPVWKPIDLAGHAGVYDMGRLSITQVALSGAVVVNARRPPVMINNDTLEFNTENFKTQPNAVVEDLLKKMPGITVEDDGTIKVNGQTVRRILVNGKDFFTGDIKMATKNLPADAVDQVQVFKKASDQAAFTGVDDGNSQQTINLRMKKDRDHALFGRLSGGGGTDGRYEAQAGINRFKGDEQLSFLGMSNNANRQGFSLTDVLDFSGKLSRAMRNGGGMLIKMGGPDDDNNGLPVTGLGQKQHGVATTTAGGLNYDNTWQDGKTQWSSNYAGSHVHLLTDKETLTRQILPGGSHDQLQQSHAINNSTQHKLNFALDRQIDSSFSFKLSPSFTLQKTGAHDDNGYSTTTGDSLLNQGISHTGSDADAFDMETEALLRKRFSKKGRTISLDMNLLYNHSRENGSLLSDNRFYTGGGSRDSSLDQTHHRDAVTRNWGGNLTYTEPVGKRSLLALSAFGNANAGKGLKKTYDYNIASGKYDALNTVLSNDFKSNYTYYGGGLSFRSNRKKWNITAGGSLQSAVLKTMNNTRGETVRQQFTDWLPSAILEYHLSRLKSLRLDYQTSTTQPSLTQLQPVADPSDPLNIIVGNPGLERQYNHTLVLNFFAADPIARKHLMAFANFSFSTRAIVRADSIRPDGSRLISYTNANGTHSLSGDIVYGFPLKKWRSRLEWRAHVDYVKNAAFINGRRNDIDNLSAGAHLGYHFNIDNLIDLDLHADATLTDARYSLQPEADTRYFEQDYGIDLTDYLPGDFVMNNRFSYTLNTGRAAGYNLKLPLWNASLAKEFLKNKRGELKFSAFDLLNQNTGSSRSSNQGMIVDEKYNVLRRYFLLSFTYSLNRSGSKESGFHREVRVFHN